MEKIVTPKVHNFDKILHTTAYLVLTLSWLLVLRRKIKSLKKTILVGFMIFVYGIIIEVLQTTVTAYRQAELNDMFANLVGITVALIVFTLFLKKNE